MMVDDTSQYYYWWLTDDDWIRVSLIAAPIMVLVGVLATVFIMKKARRKNIYRICNSTHVGYNPVYMPTTRKMTQKACCEVKPQDSSILPSCDEDHPRRPQDSAILCDDEDQQMTVPSD